MHTICRSHMHYNLKAALMKFEGSLKGHASEKSSSSTPQSNFAVTWQLQFLKGSSCCPSAESVTVAPDGSFIMLDKHGLVWRATESSSGSLSLDPKPLAHLGSGRPLGAAFDKQGNLVICDALKVRAVHYLGRIRSLSAMFQEGSNRVLNTTRRQLPASCAAHCRPLDVQGRRLEQHCIVECARSSMHSFMQKQNSKGSFYAESPRISCFL